MVAEMNVFLVDPHSDFFSRTPNVLKMAIARNATNLS
jgi:hypothetical protein